MKNYIKFIAGLVVAASLASCSQKVEFVTSSFASVDKTGYSFAENSAGGQLGVTVFPMNGAPNSEVSFKVVDGTAKKDVDFKVEPANGILVFDEDSTAYITVTPIDFDGYTGNKKFTIELTGASNGYTIGGFNTITVTITDKDHPLAPILGAYDVVTYYYDSNSGNIGQAKYQMELVAVEGDITRVACTGINKMAIDYNDGEGSFNVIGDVSEDMKTISFATPQAVKFTTGYGTLSLVWTDFSDGDPASEMGYYVFNGPILYTATETGFTSEQGAGFLDEYVWPQMGGFGVGNNLGAAIGADLSTTWTKVK